MILSRRLIIKDWKNAYRAIGYPIIQSTKTKILNPGQHHPFVHQQQQQQQQRMMMTRSRWIKTKIDAPAGAVAALETLEISVSSFKGHLRWMSSSSEEQQQEQQYDFEPEPQQQYQGVQFGMIQSTKIQKKRNKKISLHGNKTEWKEIIQIFQMEKDDFGLINLAKTLSKLRKCPPFKRSNPALPELTDKIADFIDQSRLVDAANYSSICHSLGKLRANHDSAQRIVNHLLVPEFAKAFLDTGNPQFTSKVVWSLSKLQRRDVMKSLQSQMSDKCLDSMFEVGGAEIIAHIARASATAGYSWPALFAAIEQRSEWVTNCGNREAVADIAWSCAALGCRSPELFQAIENCSKWLIPQGNSHVIASTAWACATLDYTSPELFHAIAKRWKWMKTAGTKSEVENTRWAFTTLGHEIPS